MERILQNEMRAVKGIMKKDLTRPKVKKRHSVTSLKDPECRMLLKKYASKKSSVN